MPLSRIAPSTLRRHNREDPEWQTNARVPLHQLRHFGTMKILVEIPSRRRHNVDNVACIALTSSLHRANSNSLLLISARNGCVSSHTTGNLSRSIPGIVVVACTSCMCAIEEIRVSRCAVVAQVIATGLCTCVSSVCVCEFYLSFATCSRAWNIRLGLNRNTIYFASGRAHRESFRISCTRPRVSDAKSLLKTCVSRIHTHTQIYRK